MTLELVPMLLLTLLLMASDGTDAGATLLLLSGDHQITGTHETVIVGDAAVAVPDTAEVAAPIYVIAGTTRIDGAVRARVTQVSGTLIIGDDAEIAELRHVSGRSIVSDTANVARRTSPAPADGAGPVPTAVPLAVITAALALLGARLAHTRRRNVDTVARALARHPAITVAVGALLALTMLSLFVFMAFTLVLIPVSLLGLATGLGVTALGIIAWGRRLGQRLPVRRPAAATAAGVAGMMAVLTLVGRIPLVGDVAIGFVLLSGLGAVTITYLGFSDFQPAPLPD